MNRRGVLHAMAATLSAIAAARLDVASGAARVIAPGKIEPDKKCALLIIDVQNCFVAGGSLAVKDGDAVVPVINRIAPAFDNVILTQDWHTPGHASFASAHPVRSPTTASSWPMEIRSFGPIIAYRGHTTLKSPRSCTFRKAH